METVDTGLRDLFFLSLFLIAVVYFIGLSTDVATVFTALQGLINTATGRDSMGKFAGYPGGATQTAPALAGVKGVVL